MTALQFKTSYYIFKQARAEETSQHEGKLKRIYLIILKMELLIQKRNLTALENMKQFLATLTIMGIQKNIYKHTSAEKKSPDLHVFLYAVIT